MRAFWSIIQLSTWYSTLTPQVASCADGTSSRPVARLLPRPPLVRSTDVRHSLPACVAATTHRPGFFPVRRFWLAPDPLRDNEERFLAWRRGARCEWRRADIDGRAVKLKTYWTKPLPPQPVLWVSNATGSARGGLRNHVEWPACLVRRDVDAVEASVWRGLCRGASVSWRQRSSRATHSRRDSAVCPASRVWNIDPVS